MRREPDGGRATGARALAALAALALALAWPAVPARAHVAIQLHIERPRPGERVGPDAQLVVYAQPMLFGVPETTFVVRLDGRPLDPATGAPAARPTPVRIEAGRRVRLLLRDLSPGPHLLTVRYRPDRDALPLEASVRFVVGGGGASPWPFAGAGLGAAALAAAGVLRARRRGPSAARARPSPRPATEPTNRSTAAAAPPRIQGPTAGEVGARPTAGPPAGPPPSTERS
jgi:hypothetical protein